MHIIDSGKCSSPGLLARSFDEPLQNGVKVGFLLGANSITADFAVRYSFEI